MNLATQLQPRPWLAVHGLLGAVVLLCCSHRLSGLWPESLWIDDQWVAVLVREASMGELFKLSPPSPIGFIVLLKIAQSLFGESVWALQLVPFVAGLAQIPLLGHILWRVTGRWQIAVVGGSLLAMSDGLSEGALRVKQHGLDGLLTLILLFLAWRVLQRSTLAALAGLAVAGFAFLWFSFPSLFTSVTMLHTVGLALLLQRSQSRFKQYVPLPSVGQKLSRRAVIWVLAAFDCAFFAFYVWMLAAQRNPDAADYWHGYYLPWGNLSALDTFLFDSCVSLYTGALPGGLGLLALLLFPGIRDMWCQRELRALGVGLIAVQVAIFAAATMHLYPIGGGRTDLYFYPIAAFLVALGAGTLLKRLPDRVTSLLVLAVLGWLGWHLHDHIYRYPIVEDRTMVAALDQQARPGDGIVVYPYANWAAAYYGRWDVRLVAVNDSTNRFYAHLQRPDTLVLSESHRGVGLHTDPHGVLTGQLQEFLAKGYARLLVVEVLADDSTHNALSAALRAGGYRDLYEQSDYRPIVADHPSAGLLRLASRFQIFVAD